MHHSPGNPAVVGRPVDRKLCALAFRRVCPDQTYAKSHNVNRSVNATKGAFSRSQYDLAHIREILVHLPRELIRDERVAHGKLSAGKDKRTCDRRTCAWDQMT